MLRLQHQSHAIDPHSPDIPSSLQAAVVAFRLRFLSLHFRRCADSHVRSRHKLWSTDAT